MLSATRLSGESMANGYTGDIGVQEAFTTHFYDSSGTLQPVSSTAAGDVVVASESVNVLPEVTPYVGKGMLLAYMQVVHDVLLGLECIQGFTSNNALASGAQVTIRNPQ
jgi:hypothetical protein